MADEAISMDGEGIRDGISRALGSEFGRWCAENNPNTAESVVDHLKPDRWIRSDFGKAMG